MENTFQGTFDVTVNNVQYTLRPTFHAMQCLVDKFKMSEREIFSKITDGKYSASMIVNVIYAGILGQHQATSSTNKLPYIDSLGEWMMMEGITNYVTIAQQFLLFALVPRDTAIESINETIRAENRKKMKEADLEEPQKKTAESNGPDSSQGASMT